MDPFKPLLGALAMPWEKGWGAVLCGRCESMSDIRSLDASLKTQDEIMRASGGNDSLDRARRRLCQEDTEAPLLVVQPPTIAEREQKERLLLLGILEDWLLGDRGWSKLGSILADTKDMDDRSQIMMDAFAERSTGTLALRVQALKLYGRWKGKIVPFDEESAYMYMCHLRKTKAPPTRGKSFLEAALLLSGVANAEVLTEIANSSRLRGAAYGMVEHKRMRKQRDPLTLKQVKALEHLAVQKKTACEVAVLGHCLFALHACARWGDILALVVEPEVDEALVSVESKRTKTSRGLKRLRIPIPFVAIRHGVSGADWGQAWTHARVTCGLGIDPSINKLSCAVAFGAGTLDSTTASRHLRAFLVEAGCPPRPNQNIGTHSLKATLLSWAAKWSMRASSRRVLGKHSDRKDHSMLTYSRDICISALKDVSAMFAEIREGKFDPDASRSMIVTSISSIAMAEKRMSQGTQGSAEDGESLQIQEDDKKTTEVELSGSRLRDGKRSVEQQQEDTDEGHSTTSDDTQVSELPCSDDEDDEVLNLDIHPDEFDCALGDYLINPKSGCAHVAVGRGLLTACGVAGLGFAVHKTWDNARVVCESFCKKCKP